MSKQIKPVLFRVEPVKPRNRIAAVGLQRQRGGAHVKPYGAVRQSHKAALRAWLCEVDDIDAAINEGDQHA